MFQIVLDTNVLRAGLWSSTGASFELLRRLPHRKVTILLSVTLFFEYEEVLSRPDQLPPGVNAMQMMEFLKNLAAMSKPTKIFYGWRPWLRDPDDDMLLELAVAGSASHIITYNLRDFAGVAQSFGIQVMTPAAFLRLLPPT